MHRAIILVIGLVLISWTGGCCLHPGVVEKHKGNVTAFGVVDVFCKVHYHRIDVGSPQSPFDGKPDLSIRMPGGRVLKFSELDALSLRKQRDRGPSEISASERGTWPEGAEELGIGPCFFTAAGNEVLRVSVGMRVIDDKWVTPEISSQSGKEFYRFPLTERQLNQLLGTMENGNR